MFHRWRSILVLITILMVVIYLPVAQPIQVWLRFKVRQISRPIYRVVNQAKEYFSIIVTLSHVIQDNHRLQVENTQLLVQIGNLKEVEQENNLLKKQLALPVESSTKFITASVVGLSPHGDLQSILIDKGTQDGVIKNATVIVEGFLVGVVSATDAKTSLVQLTTSHRLRLATRLQDSRTIGLLRGGIRGIIVEDIPVDTEVKIGELVVTVGRPPGILPGIPIGQVEQILSGKSDIYQTVLIKSPINLRTLDKVLVISEPP